MKYVTFAAIGNFLLYLTLSCAYLAIFMRTFIWFTPYNEMQQMREGKKASSIVLVGAMLGFTMPLLAMSFYGVNVFDFLIWSAIAMGIQLALFKILNWITPEQVQHDNQAVGVFFAGAAVCVGLINAFSLIPPQ